MWKLETEENAVRTYRNSVTHSECQQHMCFSDTEGNRWWEFTNLLTIPFTRSFAANKITSLYALGLTMEDVNSFVNKHKQTLRSSDDGQKYERAYADLLDFETRIKAAQDPVRQITALTCVYFTLNDEPIDSFINDVQLRKMSYMEADPYMQTFFLKRQISLIESSTSFLRSISETVSELQKEN